MKSQVPKAAYPTLPLSQSTLYNYFTQVSSNATHIVTLSILTTCNVFLQPAATFSAHARAIIIIVTIWLATSCLTSHVLSIVYEQYYIISQGTVAPCI